MSQENNTLLIVLGAIAIICILVSYFNHHYRKTHFMVVEPIPTTDTENVSENVYQILKKNQEDQQGYNQFLKDLEKKGIASQKIDMKFYLTAGQAYRNRLLTRAYIVNRLST
jgi:FtsZ-interacting cell division protein ZipA